MDSLNQLDGEGQRKTVTHRFISFENNGELLISIPTVNLILQLKWNL